uniref:CID domain-containing protein n=1 Tax=Syphacia muris TaxID=451379 RepID=A0A0N5APR9_9BILA
MYSHSTSRNVPKDVEVAIQFLIEVLRTEKTEMLIGNVNAIFDSVVSFIAELKNKSPNIQEALFSFLDWSVENLEIGSQKQSSQQRETGKRLALDLLKTIEEHDDSVLASRSDSGPRNSAHVERSNLSSESDTQSNDGFVPNYRVSLHSASTSGTVENQQTIDDLLMQLNLRQVSKFEPIFPTVLNDDSDDDDDDSSLKVDEQRLAALTAISAPKTL